LRRGVGQEKGPERGCSGPFMRGSPPSANADIRPQRGVRLRLSKSNQAARPSAFAAACADGRAATWSMNDLIAGHFAKSMAKYFAQFSTV
jgi:hypothetical protein